MNVKSELGDSVETILDASAVDRAVKSLSSEILACVGSRAIGLVAIQRGGLALAERLRESLPNDQRLPLGRVDISLYRDDAATSLPDPRIGPSQIPFDVEGADIVLVDDVMQTGRTVRAAIHCVLDYGRPRRIWLAVLVDRGGRELPIVPDFIGETLTLPASDRVDVDFHLGAERVTRRAR